VVLKLLSFVAKWTPEFDPYFGWGHFSNWGNSKPKFVVKCHHP